jgi:hypothetical protein
MFGKERDQALEGKNNPIYLIREGVAFPSNFFLEQRKFH